jgi:uncharacterized membrane protein
MSTQRILGIVLLVVGVTLMIVGMNASHSAVDQVNHAVTGRFTSDTAWFIYGGLVSAIVGFLMVVFGVRSKSA